MSVQEQEVLNKLLHIMYADFGCMASADPVCVYAAMHVALCLALFQPIWHQVSIAYYLLPATEHKIILIRSTND